MMNPIINNLAFFSIQISHNSHLPLTALLDLLTGLAYFTIPLAIFVFVRKKKTLKYKWMYLCFTLFILLCGITHILHVLQHFTSFQSLQTLQTIAAGLTATISIISAVLIWTLIPKLLKIPDPEQLEAANKEIMYLAHYDQLTGLINRYHFKSLIEQEIVTAKRNGQQLSVAFIDLDRFKVINDTYGHGIGDLLLEEVSKRILSSVRPKDIVSRQGGDEFIILFQDIPREEVELILNKLIKSLSSLYILDGKEVNCTPSIGISCFPSDAIDAESLVKFADLAMYKAKENGSNNYQFFTKAMNDEISIKRTLENDLRSALKGNEFEVYYQPQLFLKTNRVVSMEALVRWHHPVKGFISPCQFIPLAEETGLINPIGEWVLNEACKQTKLWRDKGYDISTSVNLSNQQLMKCNIVETIKAIILENKLEPQYLTLEITESMEISNFSDTLEKLNQLKDIGINISLDDFGTGYSSLSYLSTLPINSVKIDKSFIDDINHSSKKEIVKSISNIAHSLGLCVVAEGVEDKEQFDIIQSLGIGKIQGYLVSKPIPKEEMEMKFLKQQ